MMVTLKEITTLGYGVPVRGASRVAFEKGDEDLLMGLQYSFPLDSTTPLVDVASEVGMDTSHAIERVRKLINVGVIKRIGFNVNYKAFKKVAALVAIKTTPQSRSKLVKILLSDKEVTHNYVRNHPKYDVWFVTKRATLDELVKSVRDVADEVGSEDYLILLGKRTYKLAVKFDVKKGISWSNPEVLPENIPTVEELGVNKDLIRNLANGIPVKERPYEELSKAYGMEEEEVASLLKELYDKRVIRNVGATLNEDLVGIGYDGMVVMNAGEDACEKVALNVPEATHVVYRVAVEGEWEYPAYFMVHASTKDQIEEVAKRAFRMVNAKGYMVLYSIANLKPFAHIAH